MGAHCRGYRSLNLHPTEGLHITSHFSCQLQPHCPTRFLLTATDQMMYASRNASQTSTCARQTHKLACESKKHTIMMMVVITTGSKHNYLQQKTLPGRSTYSRHLMLWQTIPHAACMEFQRDVSCNHMMAGVVQACLGSCSTSQAAGALRSQVQRHPAGLSQAMLQVQVVRAAMHQLMAHPLAATHIQLHKSWHTLHHCLQPLLAHPTAI